MAELLQNQSSSSSAMINIKITDIKIDAMKSILDFFYEGEAKVASEIAIDVLNAAKKFKINELENHIMENMLKLICFNNFIGFYVATKDDKWKKKTVVVVNFMIV
jgi:hypothetical protein